MAKGTGLHCFTSVQVFNAMAVCNPQTQAPGPRTKSGVCGHLPPRPFQAAWPATQPNARAWLAGIRLCMKKPFTFSIHLRSLMKVGYNDSQGWINNIAQRSRPVSHSGKAFQAKQCHSRSVHFVLRRLGECHACDVALGPRRPRRPRSSS